MTLVAQVDSETLQVYYYYYTTGGIPPLINDKCVVVPVDCGVEYQLTKAARNADGTISMVPDPEKVEMAFWDATRQERDTLLKNCDWTQLADAPLTSEKKALWSTYRQALRDVPAQQTYPTITWPDAPQ
jgi:hypothetical protein